MCGDIILDIPHAPDAEDASCFDPYPIENSAVYMHLSELQLEENPFSTWQFSAFLQVHFNFFFSY